jgi:hypothetical protein
VRLKYNGHFGDETKVCTQMDQYMIEYAGVEFVDKWMLLKKDRKDEKVER